MKRWRKEEQKKEDGGDKDDFDEEKTEKKERKDEKDEREEKEEKEEDGGDKDDFDEEKVERNEKEEEEDGANQHTAELVVNTKPWEEEATTMMPRFESWKLRVNAQHLPDWVISYNLQRKGISFYHSVYSD